MKRGYRLLSGYSTLEVVGGGGGRQVVCKIFLAKQSKNLGKHFLNIQCLVAKTNCSHVVENLENVQMINNFVQFYVQYKE